MGTAERLPRLLWRLFHFLPPRLAYELGLGRLVGGAILLLQTTGRKSGLPRVTPLLYDKMDGVIYVGSARGEKADWYCNLRADPHAVVTIGSQRYSARAELITDTARIADFLELRLARRGKMLGAILSLEGVGRSPTRKQLERFGETRALVALHISEDPAVPIEPSGTGSETSNADGPMGA